MSAKPGGSTGANANVTGRGKKDKRRKMKKAESPSECIRWGVSAEAFLRSCPGGQDSVLIRFLFLATKQK